MAPHGTGGILEVENPKPMAELREKTPSHNFPVR